ncbi:T9SS type A sorting domain-containing protein [Hymenobacter sp. HSC-4F20]|uniref:GEVED domain-containing protein n=1 Tax=Hymenobacter sp. HSC-4F20 TaxID=2864135 RepID=UPI001C73C746|nr:GEVED domain-containing protein [Hymenobacter sp. HSC-4F20]MBX0291429.1 T9SS type A sorting domain-containing protein [Hymenobacter sp. HSC-4F20]
MKKTMYALALAGLGLGLPLTAEAQTVRQCATMENLAAQVAADPALAQRLAAIEGQTQQFVGNPAAKRSTAVITIPVVVHVLYNTTAQNISDAQIQSQIAVLNEDFSKTNADASKTPAAFAGLAANANLQFVLAKQTPTGAATTGIERKSTTKTSWATDDAMKSTATGGLNAWDASKYLNLWVCNLSGGILGYAQFPGGAASTDGVVILTSAFGRGGSSSAPFNLGRTATHEVGHWLNLRHIWGDASCGNDLVSDTPTQQTSNYGCPSFPHVTCSNGSNGDMFMNYMDYTDDACMYMFSNGQSARMNALFAAGGARASLATSTGGTAPGGTTPTPTTPTYCASKGGNTSYEWIDLVQLGAISRTSGANAGYYDGTALGTTVAAGSTQTISYSAGYASTAYTEYWKVYIDYNQDGDFTDSGELVASRSSASASTLTSTFTVPATAKTGKTRLRIVMSDASATTSCGSYSYGETEDYSITVSGGTARQSGEAVATGYRIFPNPATDVLNLEIPASISTSALSVRVFDVRGAEMKQVGFDGNLLSIGQLAKGVYTLRIADGQQVTHQRFIKE